MRKLLLGLLLASCAGSAFAADNAVVLTPGTGVTLRSRDTTGSGGPQSPVYNIGDPAGNVIGGNFTAYGTSPGTPLAPYTNAYVTNANTNGRSASGAITGAGGSSPVVLPSVPTSSLTVMTAANTAIAVSIKATPAVVYGCQMSSTNSGAVWVHLFNKNAAPTLGTDSAWKTLVIPGNGNGAGSNASFGSGGIALTAGFALSITGAAPTIDNTTPTNAANAVVVSCDYE